MVYQQCKRIYLKHTEIRAANPMYVHLLTTCLRDVGNII